MPRAKAKAKEPTLNQIIVKEEKIPDPTPPPSPPTPPPSPPSPPVLERQPKKRNPPNYKLKMGILHVLQEKYKVEDAVLDEIADLFHIFARASAIDSYKI